MAGRYPSFLPGLGFKDHGSFAKCTVCRDDFEHAKRKLDEALADPEHPVNRLAASGAPDPEALSLLGALVASLPVTGTWVRYGDTPVCLPCAQRLSSKAEPRSDEHDTNATA
jgi:hypothetical protein